MERRLAAILTADAVSFSILGGHDETRTVHALKSYIAEFGSIVDCDSHNGNSTVNVPDYLKSGVDDDPKHQNVSFAASDGR